MNRNSTSSKMHCPVCGNPHCREIFRNIKARVSFQEGSFPMVINLCEQCTFVFQGSACSPEYDRFMRPVYENYDEQQLFDFPRRSFDNRAAVRLILDNAPDVQTPNVLEIGSNKGDLLFMIKEKWPSANVLGVEPARNKELKVPTIRAFFAGDLLSTRFDVIILKQVLEHIKDPRAFLSSVVPLLKPEGILYLEVPNFAHILETRTEGYLLEHVGYYTLATLERILEDVNIVLVENAGSLRTICKKGRQETLNALQMDPSHIKAQVKCFEQARARSIEIITQSAARGCRIVFYGVYNCFRMLYREIGGDLNPHNCYYYDDNYQGACEPVFGLRRAEALDDEALVILCSNNSDVLQEMSARLNGLKSHLLRPWLSLDGHPIF